jgi:hypothetical protein
MFSKTKNPGWEPGFSHSVEAISRQAGTRFSYPKASDLSNTKTAPGPARALRRALMLATEPALREKLAAALASLEGRRP